MTIPPDLPKDWPHSALSQQIIGAHQRWHVQQMGTAGPGLLLIHGAAGSLHCWAQLAPLLAAQFRVIALDVGGHGFSQKGRLARAGLQDVSHDIASLAQAQGWDIAAVIGHSAGAAIALQLARHLPLRAVVGLNAALSQFDGVAGWLFPAMAKTLSLLPFSAHLGARMLGSAPQIDRLLAQTGAKISAQARAQYLTLARRPAHIGAALDMMAAWDLRPLLADMPHLSLPVLLITGQNDGAVPAGVSANAAKLLPNARAEILPDFGHLLPEEAPVLIAPMVTDFLQPLRMQNPNQAAPPP